MNVKRRTILKSGAIGFATYWLNSCEGAISGLSDRFGGGIPERLSVAESSEIDPDFHYLNRLSFGPWPGEYSEIKMMGRESWLSNQLDYKSIDDSLSNLRTRRFESRYLSCGDCFDVKKEVLREDLVRYTLLKAIYSKRQLLEVMVNFWNDHLNINIEKGNCVYFKSYDDKDVVRKHALGNFRDLIRASCLSPCMLEYLDGKENKKATARDIPNENYARELLELHTLGVNGGYKQKDVLEASRCLTGWRIKEKFGKGKVFFEPKYHDNGQKIVLGEVVPQGGGARDIDRLIDIACGHHSTSIHIASKLVKYFVSDEPSENLVNLVAGKFRRSHGDIKATLETLFSSKEFNETRGNKIKRPYRFMVSALRACGADTFAHQGLFKYLSRMGQEPFQHPTPDGYPEETLPWLGTLLWRWNFAFSFANNKIPSVKLKENQLLAAINDSLDSKSVNVEPARLFQYFVGRKPTDKELSALLDFQKASALKIKSENAELLGLILASPAFQRY